MQYYSFNINDYTGSTAHLDPLEDIAYRRLIDYYYQSEGAIPADLDFIAKRIRMRGYINEILAVLEEFFIYDEDAGVWRNERCDRELAELYERSEKARKSAQARWSKTKGKQSQKTEADVQPQVEAQAEQIKETAESLTVSGFDANAMRTQCERNATQYPIPNTVTTTTTACAAARFETDFAGADLPVTPSETVFAMHPTWRPADADALALMLRNARLPDAQSELFAERLVEFVGFWLGKPEAVLTEAQWTHKLVQSLLHAKANGLFAVKAVKADAKQGGSAAVLAEAKRELEAGKLKTATALPVFAAVLDGLTDCIGYQLAFPPAKDNWGATLRIWDREFARLKLAGAEDAEAVKDAFARTIRMAEKTEQRKFPHVHDVIRNMPVKGLMPSESMRADGGELSEEERAKRREASDKARAAAAGIGAILSKQGSRLGDMRTPVRQV